MSILVPEMSPTTIEIHPLVNFGEVLPGDDLAALVVAALGAASLSPRIQDVLVITQKIVSKAEDRFVDLATVTPGAEAQRLADITQKDARFVELVLAESIATVRAVPNILITRHRSGHVMANAGIDRSNLGPGRDDHVLLLPKDADGSAAKLRVALARRFEEAPAVLISDSFGRPWRLGVTNVALGASGMPALIDQRGQLDRNGRALAVTQLAFGDMLATAAGLATGEADEGVPAALVRGLSWTAPNVPASALIRPLEEDLFR